MHLHRAEPTPIFLIDTGTLNNTKNRLDFSLLIANFAIGWEGEVWGGVCRGNVTYDRQSR
jgi:hypothetical protein